MIIYPQHHHLICWHHHSSCLQYKHDSFDQYHYEAAAQLPVYIN